MCRNIHGSTSVVAQTSAPMPSAEWNTRERKRTHYGSLYLSARTPQTTLGKEAAHEGHRDGPIHTKLKQWGKIPAERSRQAGRAGVAYFLTRAVVTGTRSL